MNFECVNFELFQSLLWSRDLLILSIFAQRSVFIRSFLKLASVNVLSNLMVPLAGLIDVMFLGHLTEIRHLAGVAIATILFNYIYWTFGFLRMGTTGMVAQAIGRKDNQSAVLISLQHGIFQGSGNITSLKQLLQTSVVSSLVIGLMFATAFIFAPESLLRLLTNHTNIINNLRSYIPWLLPVLGFGSVAYALDGYFLGLTQGHTLRQAMLKGRPRKAG
ncbi:Na+-driven multidrug efflux pump [Nostoc flagelliforme CCNUN1]|uniref:Na+-driven multidrug efflux pump n=1 Tax=Nostoc flagelliforme CCNUN1 TaxID=2038116 RepID=A0A2K8T3W4_9NOSO|nr:Na+-driven multidrug efflux pump [Nostoc flagelliforme CCNUN1]